jgi:hypothetical protein
MKRKPIEPSDVQAALDGWADCIAPLGADVAERVAAHAHRLAVDPRISRENRAFARAQASAICRAIRRAREKAAERKRRKPAEK